MAIAFNKPLLCPVLIGRTTELAALRLLMDQAKSGQGQVAPLAHSLNRLGNWHLNAEQPCEALQYHQEALTLFQKVHDSQGFAETYDLLGMANTLGGDLFQAAAYYQQAIVLLQELDDRQGLTSSLATLMCLGGEYETETMVPAPTSFVECLHFGEEARASLEQALALAHAVGSWNWIRIVSGFLAPVLIFQQDLLQADSTLNAALEPDAAMQTIGQRLIWAARADLALARSDPGLALDITDRLIASAANLSDQHVIPRLWKLRGEALAILQRGAEAETALQAAQAAAQAQGLRPWHARKKPSKRSRLHERVSRNSQPISQTNIYARSSSHKPLLCFPRSVC